MDVCVIIVRYHKFQIALINENYRFLANFGRIKSRRLYRSVGKYDEIGTYAYCARSHGRTASDTS
jgi:hypothetical protein